MDKQLIHKIDGINYLLFELPITNSNKDKMEITIKKHGGIMQGVKTVNRSFWGNGYVIANILIPEKNVLAFNREP